MAIKLPKEDDALIRAVDRYVNTADVKRDPRTQGSTNAVSTNGGLGMRHERVQNSLLKGNISAFGNDDVHLANFSTKNNDQYNAQFISDMLNGVQMPYLQRLPSETPEMFEERVGKSTANYYSLMIDILTQLYDDAPKRNPMGEDGEVIKDDEGWTEYMKILKCGGFNSAMKEVDKLCKAHGECLLRGVLTDAEKRKYRFSVVAKTNYDLLIDLDPKTAMNDISAIILKEKKTVDSQEAGRQKMQLTHIVWTEDNMAVYIDGELVSVEANPYGRIPYVFCTENLNHDTRFKQPDTIGEAMLNAEFNDELSLFNWHIRFAGMPTTVVSDQHGPNRPDYRMIPGSIIELESLEDGNQVSFEYKAPQDRIQSFKTKAEDTLTHIFRSNGINYSFEEGIKSGTSGIAITVSMAPVLSELKRRADVDVFLENEFYDLMTDILATEINLQLPEISEVDIDYAFADSFLSAAEKQSGIDFELKSNLITRAEALMRLHPNRFKSIKEAETALPPEKKPLQLGGELPPGEEEDPEEMRMQQAFGANKPEGDDKEQ